MDIKLKCPSCKEDIDPKKDIGLVSISFLNDGKIYYCRKCRTII